MQVDGCRTTDQNKIQQAFLQYFKGILSSELENRIRINMEIINEGPSLNEQHKHLLNLHFTHNEIKEAMWSIPENKAPGLDGYNRGFYKATREIVGDDIVKAIQNFFDTGTLLKA